jgi:hypothetical protein
MTRSDPALVPAVAGISGAVIMAVHAVLIAVRPEGCVGQACSGGAAHRGSEDISWLFLIAVALLAFAVAGSRTLPRWGRIATATTLAVGAILLGIGLAINRGSSYGNPLWWLVDSDTLGRFVPLIATGIAGVAVLRSPVPRAWVAYLLLAAFVIGLPFNIQDWRVLLNLPMAAAWAVLFAVTLASARRSAGMMATAGAS